jgi:K+/H+ antiporter YhaU regulatory subunit KhtT
MITQMKNKKFEDFVFQISEKDEHKKTKGYKKLSPKMKNAVDFIMKKMHNKPQNFLNSFDKSINDTAKKFKVTKNELLDYFEKELFAVM